MFMAGTVVDAPRTVSFTAPCPECGAAAEWTQAFGERVLPEHFVAINCPCNATSRGPSHVDYP